MPNLEPLNPYSFFSPAIAGSPELQRKFAADRKPLEGAFSPPAFSQFPYFYSRMPPGSFTATPAEIAAPPRPDYSGFQPVPFPKTTPKADSSSGFLDFLGTAFPILSTLGLVDKLLGSPISKAVGDLFGSKVATGNTAGGTSPGTGAATSATQAAIEADLIADIDSQLAAKGFDLSSPPKIPVTQAEIDALFGPGTLMTPEAFQAFGASGVPSVFSPEFAAFAGPGADLGLDIPLGAAAGAGAEAGAEGFLSNIFSLFNPATIPFSIIGGGALAQIMGLFSNAVAEKEKAREKGFSNTYFEQIRRDPQAWAKGLETAWGSQGRQIADAALKGNINNWQDILDVLGMGDLKGQLEAIGDTETLPTLSQWATRFIAAPGEQWHGPILIESNRDKLGQVLQLLQDPQGLLEIARKRKAVQDAGLWPKEDLGTLANAPWLSDIGDLDALLAPRELRGSED